MPPVWPQGPPLGYPDLVALGVELSLGLFGAYSVCLILRSWPYRFGLGFLFSSVVLFLMLVSAWESGGHFIRGAYPPPCDEELGWASYVLYRFTVGLITYAWFHPAGASGILAGLWRWWPRTAPGGES